MIDSFAKPSPGTDTAAIIRTLVRHVVPIATSFLEKYLITEDRWAEYDETGEMPEVAPFAVEERPMYEELSKATKVQLPRPQWKGK